MGQRRSGLVRVGFRRAGAGGDSPSGGVTSWRGTEGLTPTSATTGDVVAGQTLVARWTVGICRIYAVDGVNGDDANLGYADPASSSAADYAIACQAAGLVALKTFAGLASIFPRTGDGRTVEIVIANGGLDTLGAYAGGLETFLGGAVGYAALDVRGTGTNTTAGVTKFDGSAADCTYLGAITGTGLNAAGYNPTGGATTTTIPCTQVGGGAPGFAAEPGVPLGLRVRFDAATATAALRGVCRYIGQRSASDTLVITGSALPAVPGVGDVFYIEMPGVSVAATSLGDDDMVAGGARQFAGLTWSGALALRDNRSSMAFCTGTSLAAISCRQLDLALNSAYAHPVRGNLTVGGVRLSSTLSQINCRGNQGVLTVLGAVSMTNQQTTTALFGFTFAAGCTFSGSWLGRSIALGNNGAPVGVGGRIIGPGSSAGLLMSGTYVAIGQVAFTNMGARPAIQFQGLYGALELSSVAGQAVSGTSGNNDVGLDLRLCRGCTIYIDVTALPTVSGALGDVRLAGDQIITWAQAAQGVTDIAGNSIIAGPTQTATAASTRTEGKRVPFSGSVLEGVGAVVSYLADTGPIAANQLVPLRRPVSGGLARGLRVTSLVNTAANPVTVTLYKNGVATTMTVTIPAGTAANTKFADYAHPIAYADTDDYDLVAADGVAGAGLCTLSGTLEWC